MSTIEDFKKSTQLTGLYSRVAIVRI